MRRAKNKHSKSSKVIVGIIFTFLALLVMYLSISLYFFNHFYYGTTVNCINVSGDTVEEADEQVPLKVGEYVLVLNERGNKEERIKGLDINLKYDSGDKIQELKDKQNPFKWFIALFDKKNSEIENLVTYDEELLKKSIDSLACLDKNNINRPQNPTYKYGSTGYEIVNEIPGNEIDKDILYKNIAAAISIGETTLDLENIDCYMKPDFTANSQVVIDTRDMLNRYVATKITYSIGDKNEVLDGNIINKWLKVNENYEITFDEKEIKNYLDKLSSNYNTVGKTRDFVTSQGNNIKVNGGDYGWVIDKEEELKDIISNIKEGQSVTREPKYMQTAVIHGDNDIGNTYVEINMTKQHLWYYKNGFLVTEGDVVTGNVSDNRGTPTGIYSVKYKERNAILKGQGYSAPVNFWMPFNGGIGIHDAGWRSEFGGRIYITNGSHGCVNAPYNLASTIFNNIEEGSPVICYY